MTARFAALASSAVLSLGLAAMPAAQAQDVSIRISTPEFGIRIGAPHPVTPIVVAPAPVYRAAPPVVVVPAPVHRVGPPVVYAPPRVIYKPVHYPRWHKHYRDHRWDRDHCWDRDHRWDRDRRHDRDHDRDGRRYR